MIVCKKKCSKNWTCEALIPVSLTMRILKYRYRCTAQYRRILQMYIVYIFCTYICHRFNEKNRNMNEPMTLNHYYIEKESRKEKKKRLRLNKQLHSFRYESTYIRLFKYLIEITITRRESVYFLHDKSYLCKKLCLVFSATAN